eukprot:CAMPEP_0182443034 /NCGR_PEP_ID=MMETSP1172-20130603/1878_1 /TAXON_ID=708627 /ORGANISM="Timspurckia oligopyrenoides, Strain CCMP3278" /LENGTH=576 /DNA_ID=CAMNT_0024638183 /DNA_START=120 /DNA_END=1850 /DNA_ORIENTATION=-
MELDVGHSSMNNVQNVDFVEESVPEHKVGFKEEDKVEFSEEELDHETELNVLSSALAHDPHVVVFLRKRFLRQFYDGTKLIREAGERKVGHDELFLDLVVVAAIATLSHEIRAEETALGFLKFVLLFGVIWNLWRDCGVYWNVWGSYGDLFDWFSVLVLMGSMLIIAVASPGAFSYTSSWIGAAGAVSHGFLGVLNIAFGLADPHFKRLDAQLKNGAVQYGIGQLLQLCVYIPVAVLDTTSETPVLILIAVSVLTSMLRFLLIPVINRAVLKPRFRIGLNIEVLEEKFGLITIIVLGESVLTLALDASELQHSGDLDIGKLVGVSILVLVVIQSFCGFYFKLDSKVLHGGIHACKRNSFAGACWVLLHFPYHLALMSGAAGIGNFIDDIAVGSATKMRVADSVRQAISTVVAAATSDGDGAAFEETTRADWWLLCGGWGAALISSALIALCHKASPAAYSKLPRLLFRCVVGLIILLIPLYGFHGVNELSLIGALASAIISEFLIEFCVAYLVEHQLSKRLHRGNFNHEDSNGMRTAREEAQDKLRGSVKRFVSPTNSFSTFFVFSQGADSKCTSL